MKALSFLSTGSLLAALVGLFIMHHQSTRLEDAVPPRPASILPASPSSTAGAAQPPADPGADTQRQVDRILARPLFNPDRRPATRAAPPAAAAAALPRLSAVLVSGRGKSVIFAGTDAAKPVTLAEGGRIGAYQVVSIGAGQVTLVGPDGTHVIRPIRDQSGTAAAAPPAAARPSVLDLLRQGNATTLPGPAAR